MTTTPAAIDWSELFEDRRKTTPWLAEEYLHVDGFACVYTAVTRDRIDVHLPGCRSASVDELRAEGRTVTLPRRVRR